MTLTIPVFLTALAMIGGLLVVSITFGRWAGELQTMVRMLTEQRKADAEALLGLRKSRHEHGEKIFVLEGAVDAVELDMGVAQRDIVALQERRKR